ncbi:MAG: hypothetical protein L3K13_02680 [Thermoplasmata archaeon]|nr:hypothetical protein [Thermoplasmata archaeon]
MTYSTVRLCSGGGSFEAIPTPKLALDLGRARKELEAAGVSVVDARVMLIARLEKEVTLARDGRILIKTTDPVVADRILRDLCARLSLEYGTARSTPAGASVPGKR